MGKDAKSTQQIQDSIFKKRCLTVNMQRKKPLAMLACYTKFYPRTSLLVQGLRVCLPMQGTWVNPWYGKILQAAGATRPTCRNYWAHRRWILCSATRKATVERGFRTATRVATTRESLCTATKTQYNQKKKLYSKWLTDLNVKHKTIQLLGEKTRGNFCDPKLSKEFLDLCQKHNT